jgi:hypothetical protein
MTRYRQGKYSNDPAGPGRIRRIASRLPPGFGIRGTAPLGSTVPPVACGHLRRETPSTARPRPPISLASAVKTSPAA